MSIVPLPVFEADADPSRRDVMTDEEILARLRPPTSIVVKFGSMRLVGEFPYDGDAKPGCGSKLVIRTVRGTEMAEMLTTTCSNSGCGKSISRKEMLNYIEASGGKDYPFHEHGRVLRVATIEDMNRWSAMQAEKPALLRRARDIAAAAGLTIKLVEVEPLLGAETTTIHYLSEERIDFRDVVKEFATAFGSRIDMRQVGARDEARLVADYERCGQHCCCKNFLKVLKPVSMRSAKVQKATLDPLKISGRCGRLMCCLRYEDQTYTELKARLPRLKSRVGTSEGPGIVMDTKILVQLALVRLEHDGREIAVPVEELLDPENCPAPGSAPASDPLRGADPRAVARRTRDDRRGGGGAPRSSEPTERGARGERPERSERAERDRGQRPTTPARPPAEESRSKTPSDDDARQPDVTTPAGNTPDSAALDSAALGEPRKKRRRRRKSRGGERTPQEQQDAYRERAQAEERDGGDREDRDGGASDAADESAESGPNIPVTGDATGDVDGTSEDSATPNTGPKPSRRKRRRRGRRRGGEAGPRDG